MKKTLLSIIAVSTMAFGANAQTFTPSAGSPLADGDVGTVYTGQTVNVDVPTTVTITGADILAALPAQASAALGTFINGSQSYTIDVTSVAYTVEGLPAGLTDDCGGCTINAGSDRDIVISGTPTQGGAFTVNLASEASGSTDVDIPLLGPTNLPFGGTFDPGLGAPIPVPALPGVMDGNDYSMNVSGQGSSISEANDMFSLGFYPNPTTGEATLDVNSVEGGVATVEVFSITGALVNTVSNSIRVGQNRINVDLNGVPAGIYLIKATINGEQALIRTQKI
jgi:hypothetical protein